jgi:hypothetical protein
MVSGLTDTLTPALSPERVKGLLPLTKVRERREIKG